MKNKNTKDAIISHAIILFGKYGYEAVSIRRIASSVGIQAGSIYNHFVSKEEILESIFDFYKEKMAQYVPTMEEMVNLAQTKTSREVLGRYLYTFREEDQELMLSLFRIVYREQYNIPMIREYFLEEMVSGQIQGIATVFEILMNMDKIPRDDPRVLATIWFNTLTTEAMLTSHIEHCTEESLQIYHKVGERLMDMICMGRGSAHNPKESGAF